MGISSNLLAVRAIIRNLPKEKTRIGSQRERRCELFVFRGDFQMSSELKDLRETAVITQIKAARDSRIERSRLSLAESGYVTLTKEEEARLRSVLKKALEQRSKQVSAALGSV
jgi:hypothetical protein